MRGFDKIVSNKIAKDSATKIKKYPLKLRETAVKRQSGNQLTSNAITKEINYLILSNS